MTPIPDIALPESMQRTRYCARAKGTRFVAAVTGSATEIDLYDEIGTYGVTAKDFRSKLRDVQGDIVLRVNSPGGSVTDGIAIYNDLLTHRKKNAVRVEISGVAASIASIIAMAGNTRAIAPNAFVMIHNAWGITIGNKSEHQAAINVLANMDEAMARTYADATKTGIRAIKQMMDEETWLNGKQAIDAGFATELLSAESDAKAMFDMSAFEATPDSLSWDDDADVERTVRDAERSLRDAGFSRSEARRFVSARDATQRDVGLKVDGLAVAVADLSAALKR
jgi:ATP-dependent Clp protease protease subunit